MVKKSLPKSPKKFAKVITNILKAATPRKKSELKQSCAKSLSFNADQTIPVDKLKKSTKGKTALKEIAKALVNKSQRYLQKKLSLNRRTISKARQTCRKPKRKLQIDVSGIRDFYKSPDISRVVAGKIYATKDGPGYLLQVSVDAANKKYLALNPTKYVSRGKFASLRPRNVLKISSSQREYCCCIYCSNIKYKLLTLSKEVKDTTKKKYCETDVNDILLCSKSEAMRYPNPDCIEGKCSVCDNYLSTLENYYKEISSNISLKWNMREKKVEGNGVKRVLTCKSGTKDKLFEEFVKDLKEPAQGITFFKHIFNAKWQTAQFYKIKNDLPDECILQVMDFAKNRTVHYQDEIKAAFYSSNQITMHPIVTYYKTEGGLVKDTSVVISDDLTHDYHAVNHFKHLVDKEIESKRGKAAEMCSIFSDGCSAQYKSKGPFADLSLSKELINRNYFGSEHGKGDCDAEIGHVNKLVDRAIIGNQVIINNAFDMYEYCKLNLEINEQLTKRSFYFVANSDIVRQRPETEVKTLQNCRKFHQILNTGIDYELKTRNLSCFCEKCKKMDTSMCTNKAFVKEFNNKKLVPLNCVNDKNQETDAFVSEKEKNIKQEDSPRISKTELSVVRSREDYFSEKLLEMQQCKNFNDLEQKCVYLKSEFDDLYPLTASEEVTIVDNNFVADKSAIQLLEDRPGLISGQLPVCVTGDGNCLPRCGSIIAFGHEHAHVEIRARIVAELSTGLDIYTDNLYLNRGTHFPTNEADNLCKTYIMFSEEYRQEKLTKDDIRRIYKAETLKIVSPTTYMGIFQLMAMSTVLKCKISSVYPSVGPDIPRLLLSRDIFPARMEEPLPIATVMWSSTRSDMNITYWIPNHFVPIIPITKAHLIDHSQSFSLSDITDPEELLNYLDDELSTEDLMNVPEDLKLSFTGGEDKCHTIIDSKPEEPTEEASDHNNNSTDAEDDNAAKPQQSTRYKDGTYLLIHHGVFSIPAVVENWPWVRFFTKSRNFWKMNEVKHTILPSDVDRLLEPPDIRLVGSRMLYYFEDNGSKKN